LRGVALSGLMIIGVKVGKKSGQVMHLHAAMHKHIAPEVRAEQARGQGVRSEDAVDRVARAKGIELWFAEPEAAAHLGAVGGGADLVDEMPDGDRRSPQADPTTDHRGGGRVGKSVGVREDRGRVAEGDGDVLPPVADVLGDIVGGHVLLAVAELRVVALHLVSSVRDMRARVPELVALVLHIMPAHPPFKHGPGDPGHVGADSNKDLASGQFREPVFQR